MIRAILICLLALFVFTINVNGEDAPLAVAAAEDQCCLGTATGPTLVAGRDNSESFSAFVRKLFDTSDYPPRWYCGNWSKEAGWLHIVSDVAIFAAYLAIPVVLLFFLLRKRRDLPFLRVFWLFAAFILACGFGHLIEATIFWWPAYRFAGLVKALTAIVSWATVIALIQIMPKALVLPGLAVLNKKLESEVAERRAAQEHLQKSHDELQQFARNALDREDRLIELKQEVNSLLRELDRESRYTVEQER